MKIRQIRFTACRMHRRVMTVAAGVLLAAACGGQSHAQSNLLNFLSGNRGSASQSQVTQAAVNGQTADNAAANAFYSGNVPVVRAGSVRTAADIPAGRNAVVPVSGVKATTSNVVSAGGTSRLAPGTISRAIGTLDSDQTSIQQVACGGCNSGSCNVCSTTGGSYGFGDACGVPCPAYRYGMIEGLYMERRGDGNFTMAQDFGLTGFDFELGARATIGYLPDCVHGWEASWVGPFEWEREAVIRGTGGPFNARFTPGNPITAANLDNFFTANIQQQYYETEYWSIDASRIIVAWDAAKILYGFRYMELDENYFYLSQNNLAETGVLTSETENRLFGVQFGLDLQHPVGKFMYTDFRGRAGVYANFADTNVNLQNDGAFQLFNAQDDEELAGVFEVGTGVRFQPGPSLTLRAGTEIWYMTGVATASDQLDLVIRPTTGQQVRADDDIFFYGITFGAEIRM